MAEYFNISLIVKKTSASDQVLARCLAVNFKLSNRATQSQYFGGKEVIISRFEYEETDFSEVCISVSKQIFHEEALEVELFPITQFVNVCFECCDCVCYALCSYEMNGYLLRGIKKLNEFNGELLNQFPIIYRKVGGQKHPMIEFHLEAQEIFE